jgi:hypothetical protein
MTVKIQDKEYELIESDEAFVKVIQELTRAIKKLGNKNGR